MWIVRLALQRPRAVLVMAILMLLLGVLSTQQMATDIFPTIDVPVVDVIWSYGGLAPSEMEQRVVNISERAFSTNVGEIEHIESNSMSGVSIIKVYFHPGVQISTAIAQISSTASAILRAMPPGMTPPLIIQFNASNVPVLQVAVSSATMSQAQITDNANNVLRQGLVTVHGSSIPPAFGGTSRSVMVDLDTQALLAKGMQAEDVANGITQSNLILPAGDAKIGTRDYVVTMNNGFDAATGLNDIPLKTSNGAIIQVRDVAQVRDGATIQHNIVHRNGNPSSLITIFRSAGSSTLAVVDAVKAALPMAEASLPPGMDVTTLLDQSIFVRASIQGVVREAAIAACLTACMILLFLGNWRSTLIVVISIPLSILCSIIILGAMGETLNTMTLGGLALAVGILVDDSTVEIENVERNLHMGKAPYKAIMDGSREIAGPAFISTISICIVFIPVAFLSGIPRALFLPLAEAVIFAMLPSYFISRTVVPMLMRALMEGKANQAKKQAIAHSNSPHQGAETEHIDPIERFNRVFMRYFEKFRSSYRSTLEWNLHHPKIVVIVAGLFFAVSLSLIPLIGEDFFPNVDAGAFRLHVRAPAGTRLEDTSLAFSQVEGTIRSIIPANEQDTILDNIGQLGGINLAYMGGSTIGSEDGEIDVSLAKDHHPTAQYMAELRQKLPALYPDDTFFFEPADITSQILNFGLTAPIDVQISGPYRNQAQNYQIIKKLSQQISGVRGAVDVHINQVVDSPEIEINVDRMKAAQLGLTQQTIASNILVSLSSSSLTAPSFWIDPKNGVQYNVTSQTPQYKISSIDDLLNSPISSSITSDTGQNISPLLGSVATITRHSVPEVISHYNIQPVFDVYANTQNRDLGGVSQDIYKIIAKMKPSLPRGSFINIVGQVQTMNSSFEALGLGLIGAIVLVYLLLVVNFESWLNPFVILTATPGALSGIVWMLFITQTTFNVPSLMGSIMCIGVATANSILLVTFANEQRHKGKDALEAALDAGYTRLRPILMTALAMIVGMVPMALGLGDGGEQNAPLGRAVIGGLLFATFNTLLFVPVVYSVLCKSQTTLPEVGVDSEPETN